MRPAARTTWIVTDTNGNCVSVDHAILATLMDLRDVLDVIARRLAPLECRNFRSIPGTLRGIRTNTERPARKTRTP